MGLVKEPLGVDLEIYPSNQKSRNEAKAFISTYIQKQKVQVRQKRTTPVSIRKKKVLV
ncbi:MAG: hypothetical protein LBQ31_02915 [Bacteroidales bacterium]|jgi:hypothetical protein|nr:hypothetical protein [Bacteroidales bacterium]